MCEQLDVLAVLVREAAGFIRKIQAPEHSVADADRAPEEAGHMGVMLGPWVARGMALQLVDDEVVLILHLSEDAVALRRWANPFGAPVIDPGKDELERLALRIKDRKGTVLTAGQLDGRIHEGLQH